MKIGIEKADGMLILAPVGRLDSDGGPELERRILEAFDQGVRHVVVDMTGVDYISSRGLRVFLIVAKRAADEGGKVAVCAVKEFVEKVFQASGFFSLMDCHSSRVVAIAEMRKAMAGGDSEC